MLRKIPSVLSPKLCYDFATLSIRAGDDLKTVQNNLGYSTITTTMSTDAHVTDRMKNLCRPDRKYYLRNQAKCR